MEQILEKLLESASKAKILRLFLRNPINKFSFEEIAKRSQVVPLATRKELKKFLKLGIVQEGKSQIDISRGSNRTPHAKKTAVYSANQKFPCFSELQDLVAKSSIVPRQKITRDLKGLGKIKLAVISGVFLHTDNSRTDLLIVGERIQKRKLEKFLADTESEIGRPVQHTIMDSKEFLYRMDMYDRFLRDIMEYPHEKLVDKFNL